VLRIDQGQNIVVFFIFRVDDREGWELFDAITLLAIVIFGPKFRPSIPKSVFCEETVVGGLVNDVIELFELVVCGVSVVHCHQLVIDTHLNFLFKLLTTQLLHARNINPRMPFDPLRESFRGMSRIGS
jgi:hypothetical protein